MTASSSDTPNKTPNKTLFQKIIDRDLPADLHLLVIPRKPLPRLCDAGVEDQALLGHLLLVANQLAVEAGYGEAFRVVINNGANAGQSVFHLHVHILAGRPLKWPPG